MFRIYGYRIEIGVGKNGMDCSETQKLTFETQLLQYLTFEVHPSNPSNPAVER